MVNTKTCPVCNTPFEFQAVLGYNYKYCSDECHRERRRQRARAKPKKPRTAEQRVKEATRHAILRSRDTPEERATRLLKKRQTYAKYATKYRATAAAKRIANYAEVRKREKAFTAKDNVKRKTDPEYAAYCRERNNKYRRHKIKTDVKFNIINKVRCRIAVALRRNRVRKIHRTITLLGCTADEFKKYLQKRFTKGMTWAKLLSAEIHVDHIKPCTSFNLTKTSEQKKCFHYTNCQPLWAMDNFSKGAKVA